MFIEATVNPETCAPAERDVPTNDPTGPAYVSLLRSEEDSWEVGRSINIRSLRDGGTGWPSGPLLCGSLFDSWAKS
jgi:hypothetical protein